MGKVEYLIVDTSAFIKNAQLHDIGDNIYTIEDVVNEIKNKRQLRRLVVLPYDLKIKDAFSEHIKFVTEFSKKTGDYPSLSATDIKVMALTYQLEKEHMGTDHLHTEPMFQREVDITNKTVINPTDITGFYLPEKKSGDSHNDSESLENGSTLSGSSEEESDDEPTSSDQFYDCTSTCDDEIINETLNELSQDLDLLRCSTGKTPDQSDDDSNSNKDESCNIQDVDPDELLIKVSNDHELEDGEQSSEDEVDDDDDIYDDDECGWITPANVQQAKREASLGMTEDKPVKVACLTTDFAMQNVLKQIGLNVVTLDGLLIKQLKTFILRCYACFKTTSIMTKIFCPNCGNKTLKKVAVTVDADGKQKIHINIRRPLTGKGKRFTLPKPQGGKHANNPLLYEGQRFPQQRLSKKALQKNNPLDPDYIAGYSPFVMRDVNSKSAMLGLHRTGVMRHMTRKRPKKCKK